jgi:tetratricopeptide (TPR) repeat protein
MAGCMISIILLRLSFDQWQSYSNGAEDLKKGNYSNAIMYFDRVLNAHIPFSPLESKAENNLLALGAKFENEKEYELALLCYETLRTSRYLTRHLLIPDNYLIPFLNNKIASIKAQFLVKDGMVRDFNEGYNQQMAIMNKDFSPSIFWSLVAVAAFWTYLGFVVLWIFNRKPLYIFVVCMAFVAWLTGLYLA